MRYLVSAHFVFLLANSLFYRKASFVIANELAHGSCSQVSCHCKETCSRFLLSSFLSLRRNLPTFLVIASRAECTARQSPCQFYTSHKFFVIAKLEKLFPRSLNVSLPRATLVAWWKQSPCKQHFFLDYFATLVMTKTKMATRHKASRHDNLLLDRHTTFAMTTLISFTMTTQNLPALLALNLPQKKCADTRPFSLWARLKSEPFGRKPLTQKIFHRSYLFTNSLAVSRSISLKILGFSTVALFP